MSRKLIGLTLALSLFAVALPASAASLTQSQISAIIGLLRSFGAEQSVINNVSVSLGGGTSGNSGNTVSCVELSYNLFSGSTDGTTGGQVTKLQRFLGVDTTGYFGPATEAAVQRWQAANGIVSSGSPDSTGYGYVGAKTRAAMRCGVDHEPYQPPVNTDWPSLSFSPFIKAGAQGDTWAEGLNIEGLAVVIKNDTQQRQQITFPTNCWYTYRIYDRVTKRVVFDLGSQQKCMAPGSAPGTTFVLAPGESKNIDVLHRDSDFHLRPGSYDMRVDINSKHVLKEAVQFLFNVAGDNNSSPSATVDTPVITPIPGSDRFDVAFKGSAVNFGGTHAGDQRYNWAWVSVVPSSYDGSLDLHAFKGKGESGPVVGSSGAEVHNNKWSHSFNLAAGTYKVLVYDYYGVSSMPITTRTITITGKTSNQTPSMRILSPNGGESYRLDQPLTLTWSAENIPAGASFAVEFRRQGGGEVAKIATADSTARSVTFPSINKIRGGDLVTMDVGAYTVNMWALVNGTELAARDSSDGMINILQPAGSNPAATIDNSSLTQTRGNFYVNGSASNATSLQIIMVTGNYTGATDWNSANAAVRANSVYNVNSTARVENGRWVGVFGSGSGGAGVPAGIYTLLVYDLSNDGATPSVLPKLLTRNTLTVQY